MKKNIIVLMTIALIFMLTGCMDDELKLTLNGESEITLQVGEAFQDPGATVTEGFDVEIKTTSDLDVTTPGTYTITYSFEYEGKEYAINRTIIVSENGEIATPTINLNGDANIEIELNSTFTDPGAIVSGDFNLDIETISNLDVTTPGTYTITYKIVFEEIAYTISRTVVVKNSNTPEIILNGDEVIYVNLYETYEELGANLSSGFDGDITIGGEVTTHTEGEYTVVYSFEYEGVLYQKSRTVHVIDFYSYVSPLELLFNVTDTTKTQITSVVTYNDGTNLKNVSIVLFDGNNEVARKQVSASGESIVFDNLDVNHLYQVRLEGSFDNGEISFVLPDNYMDIYTLKNDEYNISYTNEEITPNTYNSMLTIEDNNDLLSQFYVMVYNETSGYEEFSTQVTSSPYAIDLENLYEEENYNVSIRYIYTDPNTNVSEQKEQTLSTFTTPAIPKPSIESEECSATTNAITCTIDLNDTNFTDITVNQYIYLNGEFMDVKTGSNGSSIEFTNLSSNTTYKIVVYITYTDSQTGTTYSVVQLTEKLITTDTLVLNTVPTVENMVITEDMISSTKSITFDFDILDPDNTMTGGRNIELYVNGSPYRKAVSVGENTITFTNGIHENTNYSYKIIVDYVPSEGEYINRHPLYEGEYTTSINMNISDFMASDTLWYQENGVFEIIFNNTVGAQINSVVVNNTTYDNILFLSTDSHLFVDFGVLTNVATQIYNVEGFNITLEDGTEKFIESQKSLTEVVHERGSYIPEDATIEVVEITTSDYSILTDLETPTEITISMYVENEFNLPITEIYYDGQLYDSSNFTYNGNIITLMVEVDHYQNNYYFTHIKYMRNTEEVIYKNHSLKTLMVYGYYTEDIVNISTVEQFLNMDDSGKYYRLMNDLDFTNIPYTTIGDNDNVIGGCIDGNGYTIKNITIEDATDYENHSKYIGVFGVTSGLIMDLKLENINITVSTSDIDQTQYIGTLSGSHMGSIINVEVVNSSITVNGFESGNLGGLVGAIDHYNGRIKDAQVHTVITVDALQYTTTPGYLLDTNIGGIAGLANKVDIETSSSSGSISITNVDSGQAFDVGGIVGSLMGTSETMYSYIVNSYTTVDIDVVNTYYGRTGGIAGRTGNISFYTAILNSYSSGDIHTNAGQIGGVAGVAGNVTNSMSFGDLFDIGGVPGAVNGSGGFVGETLRKSIYIYENQEYYNSGNASDYPADMYIYNYIYVPDDTLNTAEFFTEYLNFSSHIFNFASLNVEHQILPTHK